MSDQASTIMVNTLEPQSGTTLTVGKSGQNLQVNADSLKANVAKDAGGNALFTSDGSGNLSGLNSGLGSAQTLIQTQTVTNQATVSFTSGIDSTYVEYVFAFYNINPATDAAVFGFQGNGAGESGYNESITSSAFRANHAEADNWTSLSYQGGTMDQANQTAFQEIAITQSNDADSGLAGELHLFNPASTTYVKHFYSRTSFMWYTTNQPQYGDAFATDMYVGGYFNTTTAIDDIQFKMSSGNFDGTIKLWGVK